MEELENTPTQKYYLDPVDQILAAYSALVGDIYELMRVLGRTDRQVLVALQSIYHAAVLLKEARDANRI